MLKIFSYLKMYNRRMPHERINEQEVPESQVNFVNIYWIGCDLINKILNVNS